MPRLERRRVRVVVALLVVLAALGVVIGIVATRGPSAAQIAAQRAAARAAAAARARAELLAKEGALAGAAEALVASALPARIGSAAPPVPAHLFKAPLPAHLVFGFVPYWTLALLTPSDLADASIVSYYGVQVRADGSLDQSGPGWADFQGAGFTSFVASAHAEHDRALLTLSDESLPSIKRLLAAPATSAARLAQSVEPLLVEDRLDGVDIDIEGRASSQRRPFVHFVADLTAALRRADPRADIVLDTYPQSAASGSDFYDVAALAPLVDQIFIMGYDMENPNAASADAPLRSPSLGLSDVQSVLQYLKVVPPGKLILGVPFYGYDFTTVDLSPGAPTVSPDPSAVQFVAITAAAHKAYWDPDSLTPYTRFRLAHKDHETWYDDPVSIALKTALAMNEHLAGVGAWALGYEGATTQMLQALDGTSPPIRLPLVPAP